MASAFARFSGVMRDSASASLRRNRSRLAALLVGRRRHGDWVLLPLLHDTQGTGSSNARSTPNDNGKIKRAIGVPVTGADSGQKRARAAPPNRL